MADNEPRFVLKIIWARQGNAKLENWWVEQHGSPTAPKSGLEDHISFANFDLQQSGCPRIMRTGTGLQLLGVRSSRVQTAMQILNYHGFEVISTASC
jgi:hypothetical protein